MDSSPSKKGTTKVSLFMTTVRNPHAEKAREEEELALSTFSSKRENFIDEKGKSERRERNLQAGGNE